jgi:hypothetical protein
MKKYQSINKRLDALKNTFGNDEHSNCVYLLRKYYEPEFKGSTRRALIKFMDYIRAEPDERDEN